MSIETLDPKQCATKATALHSLCTQLHRATQDYRMHLAHAADDLCEIETLKRKIAAWESQ